MGFSILLAAGLLIDSPTFATAQRSSGQTGREGLQHSAGTHD